MGESGNLVRNMLKRSAHTAVGDRSGSHHWRRRVTACGRAFAVLVAASAVLSAPGQQPAPGALVPAAVPRLERELTSDYLVRSWRVADGLPSDQVTCIAQGADGYLWVGTTAGLARFDGVRFVRFDHGNVPLLTDHRILGVAEDGEGTLWVATRDHPLVGLGLSGWGSTQPLPASVDASCQLRASAAGVLVGRFTTGDWFAAEPAPGGTGPGTTRLRPRRDVPKDVIEVLDGVDGPPIFVTAREVLLGSPGEPDARRFALGEPTVPSRVVAAAVRTAPDSVWVLAGEYGVSEPFRLYQLAAGRLSLIDAGVPQPRILPFSMAADRAGAVWHGAGNGYLGRATAEQRIRYRLPDAESDAHPVALTPGLGGTVWLAVENAGLLEIRPRLFQGIRDTEGLPHGMVRSVVPDPRGGAWAGTDDGVAWVEAPEAGGPWRAVAAGLSGHTVRALALDAEESLWAGSSRGVFVRRDGVWEDRKLPRLPHGDADGDGLGSLKVRDLALGRGGEVWVVTAHQVAMAPDLRAPLSTVAFLPSLVPTDLLEDRDGCRWVATERGGVVVLGPAPGGSGLREALEAVPGYAENRWRFVPRAWLREGQGLPSDHVWEMLEDEEGVMWMAGPRGVVRFPRETARSIARGQGIPPGHETAPFVFTSRHGLPELAINSLVEDGRGHLWLGGDLGLYRVPHADFRSVARGRSPGLSMETIRASDGLPADETNGRLSHPGAVRDAAGRIWVATIRGLACLAPETRDLGDAGPGVAIEEIRADGRILATTLPHEPEGGLVAADDGPGSGPSVRGAGAVRRLTGPVEIEPGGGRVLEIRFTGFDPNAPRALRFRYQLVGYEITPHDVGDRRVAYFTNLDPGPYRFRVWAAGRSGVWSTTPAELRIELRPRFWQTWWFRIVTGMAVAGTVVAAVAWRVRRIRQFEELRRRAERTDLRNRLARDLHDGVGSGLARLAVLAHLPEEEARDPDRVQRQFRELSGAVRELAQTVREISWTARPSAISLESLMAQITQQAGDFLGAAGIRCRTSLPLEFPSLQLHPDQRSDLYFAAKEAVTNVVRHSGATEARFLVEWVDGRLVMELWDNGRGMSAGDGAGTGTVPGSAVGGGNGLPNLRARVKGLEGRVVVGRGGAEGGTRLRIEVPLGALRRRDPPTEGAG